MVGSVCGCGKDLAPKVDRGVRIKNLLGAVYPERQRRLLAKWCPDETFDIVIKCWTFANRKSKKFEHCGEHTGLIGSVTKSTEWRKLLPYLRRKVEELWKHQERVTVVCVDSHGRHRSVAVAAILKHLYEQKGFKSTGPHHLDKDNWPKRKLCHTCMECMPNEAKRKMYDTLEAACEW